MKHFKRINHKLHLWLGLLLGLPFMVICLTGAILVFEPQILRLANPEHYTTTEDNRHWMSVDSVYSSVRKQLPDSIKLGKLRIGRPDETWIFENKSLRNAQIFVNPYTGKVTGMRDHDKGFFYSVRRLHRWFFDTYDRKSDAVCWGKLLVGISSLLSIPLLLSGLAVWWPATCHILRMRLQVCTSKGMRRTMFDLHSASGFYTLALLLILALTGLTWSFSWYRQAFYATFGVEYTSSGSSSQKIETFESGIRQTALAQTIMRHPDYRWIEMDGTTIRVSTSRIGNTRRADEYTFSPADGHLEQFTPYEQTSAQKRIRGWIVTFHEGLWLGTFSQALTFLAALIGATLPATAYYLYWKRKRNKRKSSNS